MHKVVEGVFGVLDSFRHCRSMRVISALQACSMCGKHWHMVFSRVASRVYCQDGAYDSINSSRTHVAMGLRLQHLGIAAVQTALDSAPHICSHALSVGVHLPLPSWPIAPCAQVPMSSLERGMLEPLSTRAISC